VGRLLTQLVLQRRAEGYAFNSLTRFFRLKLAPQADDEIALPSRRKRRHNKIAAKRFSAAGAY